MKNEMKNKKEKKETYRIETEDSNGDIGKLLVSPEHRIYVKNTDINYNNEIISNLISLGDENGKESDLLVSEKHKIYVDVGEEERGSIVNLSSYNMIILPSKSSDFASLSNLENEFSSASGLSCGILNQTTENIFSLWYKEEYVKSQSLVINTFFSNFENSANLSFEIPLGFEIMSNPCCLRNTSNLLFTFSSLRNLTEWDAELDIISIPHKTCCILQCCFNMFFSNSRIIFKDFVNTHSTLEHFQDLPDHNSSTFESGLSMTDFAVCNNILIDFNPHCNNSSNNEIFKLFYAKDLIYFNLVIISDIYNNLDNLQENNRQLIFLDKQGRENLKEMKRLLRGK